MFRPLAVLILLAGGVIATEADAQSVVYRSYPAQAVQGSMSYSRSYSGSTMAAQPTRAYSYSYYTLSPLPARTYVGYGDNNFSFHGVAYGHPYDPWTWPMMSGSYSRGLARYYDPPVK